MGDQRPRLIVVAGPNGSGKTTITDKLLRHEWMEGCVYINPDQIAQSEFGDWNLPENILSGVRRAQELRETCLTDGSSMAFETVFSAPDKVEFLRRAKNAGYFIRLFFICTNDPTINAQRVALRVMEGGHDVPIAKIISRYYRSISNCVEVVPWIDRAYFYDNSITDADPLLMFRVMEGRIAKSYGDMAPWADKVADTLRTARR